jgi:hypothetical protein
VTDERGTTYVAEATFVIEPAPEPVAKVNVSYTAHQQKYGNLKTVKNGKASGKSRRRTANLRKVIQSVMNRTYTDEDGEQLTGVEKLAVTLYRIAVDPSDKNCLSAMRLLIELYGEDMSPEQKHKLKAETELLKARAKKLEDDDW